MPTADALGTEVVGDRLTRAAWKTGAGGVRAALSTVGPKNIAPVAAIDGRRLATGPVPAEHGGPAEGSTDKPRERTSR